MRYDQFMKFGWKVLIPASLAWIMLVASIRTLTDSVESGTTRALYLGIGMAVCFGIFSLIPVKAPPTEEEIAAENAPIPVAQGGYPLPPMDLVVPPTPRSLQPTPSTPLEGEPRG